MFKELKNYIRCVAVRKNYKKILRKLRNDIKKRKLRIVFYVSQNQKWGYQSLYELFEKDSRFEVLVVAGAFYGYPEKGKISDVVLQNNYDFFKSRNMNVEYGYVNGKFISLKEFSPDIVFYDQFWSLPGIHKPWNVSKYALVCCCPYAFQLFKNIYEMYMKFYRYTFKYYITHELNMICLQEMGVKNTDNCKVIGYPKLDVYTESINADCNIWKDSAKYKIIYAPHHSFETGSLSLATFLENGKLIQEWAEKHPETTWIFKPHPKFKDTLKKFSIMNDEEIEKYYDKWNELGVVYTQGDYFDIFKSSDLMITDCGSFLAEYLPTKKPLIRPVNKNAIEFNAVGELVTSEFYQTKSNDELLNTLEEIVVNYNDIKKEAREKLADSFFDYHEKAVSKLYKDLLDEIVPHGEYNG